MFESSWIDNGDPAEGTDSEDHVALSHVCIPSMHVSLVADARFGRAAACCLHTNPCTERLLTPLESVEHGAVRWRAPQSARILLQLFISLYKLLSAYAFPFSSLSLTPTLAQAGHKASLASTPAARPAPLATAHGSTSDRIRFCAAPPPLPSSARAPVSPEVCRAPPLLKQVAGPEPSLHAFPHPGEQRRDVDNVVLFPSTAPAP